MPRLGVQETIAPTETHFAQRRREILTLPQLRQFREFAKVEPRLARRTALRLQPPAELVRSEAFVADAIETARETGCQIELEGSALSHIYYQLTRAGVPVKVVDPFEGTARRASHGKLVRDAIPNAIESGGEVVRSYVATPEELLPLLKVKIIEEAFELFEEENPGAAIDEIVDVIEIVLRLAKLYGADIEALTQRVELKREARGGFDDGIVLIETHRPTVHQAFTASEGRGSEPGAERGRRPRLADTFNQVGTTGDERELEILLVPPPRIDDVPRGFRVPLGPDQELVGEYAGRTLRLSLQATVGTMIPGQLSLLPDADTPPKDKG
jgi:predicted house-cleaning noncanonical NTP pyrophosphatase (MazG superfamily)